ncbi:hypothetical protein TNCV_4885691 [Trichonephila clavipes]|uniref:Uncharacterized protein n=1 Tax=Trichonephila clavipes TaxID=2585209 RepID=A0A8X6V5W4_TRICX|nr:hypothetical protein TNCV_4885691 [Trichonephila clavipes]
MRAFCDELYNFELRLSEEDVIWIGSPFSKHLHYANVRALKLGRFNMNQPLCKTGILWLQNSNPRPVRKKNGDEFAQ